MLVKHNFVELEKVASNRGFTSAPRACVRELHTWGTKTCSRRSRTPLRLRKQDNQFSVGPSVELSSEMLPAFRNGTIPPEEIWKCCFEVTVALSFFFAKHDVPCFSPYSVEQRNHFALFTHNGAGKRSK